MGRKRTSVKKRVTLSVDKDIIEKLKELDVDRSLLFTKAAKRYIEKEEKEKKEKGLD